jgi:mono/diheme cytochrome c family protein
MTPAARTAALAAFATVVGAISYFYLATGSREAGSGPLTAASAKRLIDRYCVDCHNDADFTANLSVAHADLGAVGEHPEQWEKVIRKLRAGMMPPPGEPRPSRADAAALTQYLEQSVDASSSLNPGSTVLHRLNRTEYANAVRDLLAVEVDPAKFLPPDDSSRGFDNIAGSLTISPTLLEAYVTAATKIARMAVGYWKTPTESLYIVRNDSSQADQLAGQPFGTRGGVAVEHVFPADGEYRFTVRNLGVGTFIPNETLELSVDGERVHSWVYTGMGLNAGMDSEADGELVATVPVHAGSRTVAATFVATNYRPSLDVAQHFERQSLENGFVRELTNYPEIGALRIEGPFAASRPEDSPSLRKVLVCRPEVEQDERPCATKILAALGRRAFRRPLEESDIDALMAFYDEARRSGSFEDGIELAVRRILASPRFLVRVEREPADVAPGAPYRISDLELASRLSFFLWSSIPDDELIDAAARGELAAPAVLEAQVRRMLGDSRSQSLVDNFARQWLYLRNLETTAPAQTAFPDWDHELRRGFERETELLFETVLREDRSVLDFLDADYTFLNERLAKHYGIPNIYGAQYRRVALGPELDYRRGILGQGSFLSMTWVQNNRTSPVKRGVWVLENILGTPPPEPPPNVPGLEETAADTDAGPLSLREQMTKHRSSEPCASCHKIMDPIGFALEPFTADAKWRSRDASGAPIDAAVELWDGTRVAGPVELRAALLKYSPQFVRTLTEKLMTYALGRGVEYYDMPVVRRIAADAERNGYKFSSIVLGIVSSPQFQMRSKAEAPADERVARAAGERR